jgi:hypothetical protein
MSGLHSFPYDENFDEVGSQRREHQIRELKTQIEKGIRQAGHLNRALLIATTTNQQEIAGDVLSECGFEYWEGDRARGESLDDGQRGRINLWLMNLGDHINVR